MELQMLSDVDALLAHREAWDDLWHRSRTVLPTARAELAAHWLHHFAQGRRFTALAVSDGDRLVAALPLVQRRIKGIFRAGDLPANPWAANGDLLLDESADVAEVLQCLCRGLRQTGWPMVWVDLAPVQTSRWRRLVDQSQKADMSCLVHLRYPVGLVYWEDFAAYWASRPHGLQKKVRKCLRQLEQIGPIELRVLPLVSGQEWEEALDTAWRIEDASWKGQAGTSVLRTPGMREFYLKQTQMLAQWGYARLAFLEAAGRPIAFAFGWETKGVVQVWKISYDPEFSRFSPGHLLWYLWFQKLAESNKPVTVDFLGPLTDGTRPWAAGSYPIGRLILATRWWGKCLMGGYRAYRGCRGTAAWPDWADECTAAEPHPLALDGEVIHV